MTVLNTTKCDLCFPLLLTFQVTQIIDKTLCQILYVPTWGFASIISIMMWCFCSNALDLFHTVVLIIQPYGITEVQPNTFSDCEYI